MHNGLESLRQVVRGATLPAETQQSVLRCIDKLPPLYSDWDRTYDIRYRDGIARIVEQILHTLGTTEPDGAEGNKVADALISRLAAMHQRLGIPSLGLKPRVSKPVLKQKRSKPVLKTKS
jgi:hypothetical protein